MIEKYNGQTADGRKRRESQATEIPVPSNGLSEQPNPTKQLLEIYKRRLKTWYPEVEK